MWWELKSWRLGAAVLSSTARVYNACGDQQHALLKCTQLPLVDGREYVGTWSEHVTPRLILVGDGAKGSHGAYGASCGNVSPRDLDPFPPFQPADSSTLRIL